MPRIAPLEQLQYATFTSRGGIRNSFSVRNPIVLSSKRNMPRTAQSAIFRFEENTATGAGQLYCQRPVTGRDPITGRDISRLIVYTSFPFPRWQTQKSNWRHERNSSWSFPFCCTQCFFLSVSANVHVHAAKGNVADSAYVPR